MSDAPDPRPWFRPKEIGLGWTPATWQGWLITLAFCLLIAATVQLVVPQSPREAAVFPWLAAARRDLGVPAAGLGLLASVVAMGLEIAAFLAVAWWTARRAQPQAALTDQSEDGVWFRRRTWGLAYNLVPVAWQGWVLTLALAPILLATVFAGNPSMSKPSSLPFFLQMKAVLGLNSVHLPPVTVAALLAGEVLAFVFLALWKSRTLRPLD